MIVSWPKSTMEHTSAKFFSELGTQLSERSIAEKLPKESATALSCHATSELARLRIIEARESGAACTPPRVMKRKMAQEATSVRFVS